MGKSRDPSPPPSPRGKVKEPRAKSPSRKPIRKSRSHSLPSSPRPSSPRKKVKKSQAQPGRRKPIPRQSTQQSAPRRTRRRHDAGLGTKNPNCYRASRKRVPTKGRPKGLGYGRRKPVDYDVFRAPLNFDEYLTKRYRDLDARTPGLDKKWKKYLSNDTKWK